MTDATDYLNTATNPHARFDELAALYLADALSPQEADEMRVLLGENRECVRALVYMSLAAQTIAHNEAVRAAADSEQDAASADPVPAVVNKPLPIYRKGYEPKPSRFRPHHYAVAIAAALLVAGIAVAIVSVVSDHQRQAELEDRLANQPVATLIQSTGGELTTPTGYPSEGRDYPRGEYTLSTGSAEYMLTNAVNVKLRGETHMSMHNDMHVSLTRGSAEFVCPTEAKGFTVHLPDQTKIVDLGTRFRVTVDEYGASLVTVIEGTVSLRRGDGDPVILNQAASARISSDPTAAVVIEKNPPILAEAAVWLTADRITNVNAGDPIGHWPGASIVAHGAGVESDRSPFFVSRGINGRPSVRFDGAQRLTLPSVADLGIVESDYEVFIVAHTDRPETQFLLALDGSGGHENFEFIINHPVDDVGFSFVPTRRVYVQGGTNGEFTSIPHVFYGQVQDGVAHVAVDGQPLSSKSAPEPRSDAAETHLVLGVRGNGKFPFVGEIAELLIFDSALTGPQRSAVLEHLSSKYKINVPLPFPPTGDPR